MYINLRKPIVMLKKIAVALTLAGLATSAGAVTNLLTNGSFEAGVAPDANKPAGSTDITGWTVLRIGGVFYADASWDASDGNRSVELNGIGRGTIYQDVATVIGKRYRLTFDYSVDPNGTRLATPFTVGGGGPVGFNYVRPAGHSATNMQYLQGVKFFTAADSLSRVAFVSGTVTNRGAVIDNAFLTVVPEPATWALLIAGFGMVGFSMRRRRSAIGSVSN